MPSSGSGLTSLLCWQAEIKERSGDEIVHLHAERDRLSACLEEQHSKCAQLTQAAAAAKEASARDLSRAQTQAEEATLAAASMADVLRECRQQFAVTQQQNLKSTQVSMRSSQMPSLELDPLKL